MKKGPLYSRRGFSLLEAVLSASLFAFLVTTLMGAFHYGKESTALAGARARAVFLAEEGLEAVRNMRDENFSNLVDGAHGLAIAGGQWIFSGTEDTTDVFTRRVTISPVDASRKNVVSAVTWQGTPQRVGTVSLATRLTDWRALVSTQADNLRVDTSGAATDPADNTRVLGVTIENIGSFPITVAQMTVSWSGVSPPTRLNGITIGGSSVFSGNAATGDLLDIIDFTLAVGGGAYPVVFDFNRNMSGATLTVTFTMADASAKTVTFSFGGAAPDTTPPAAVADLAISGVTSNSVVLSWTAPGDDGTSGTAASYDIRYATSSVTDATWSSAIRVTGEPAPAVAGTAQSMTVGGLSPSTTYYFALRTSDEVPNTSSLSNVPSAATLTPAQADSLVVNTSGARINPSDNTQVIGITLQNIGSSPITITHMTVSWSGVPGATRLQRIVIGGSAVFSGTATSGTLLDITDVTMTAGAIAPLDVLDFSRNMTGGTLAITFTMSDGSAKTVSGIVPYIPL